MTGILILLSQSYLPRKLGVGVGVEGKFDDTSERVDDSREIKHKSFGVFVVCKVP